MNDSTIYNFINTHENITHDELYKLLQQLYSIDTINFVMYDLFKYVHQKTEEKIIRSDQHTFRKDLITRYGKCIITGSDPMVCDACHIIPFSECMDIHNYDQNNGLLLRKDIHPLFDKKILKINPDTLIIELSDDILNNRGMAEYHKYNGKQIEINNESIKFLKQIY
jgi:hypothetical protein